MLHIYVCWLMPGSVAVLLSEVFDDFSSVPRDQSGWRLGMFIFHPDASPAGGWEFCLLSDFSQSNSAQTKSCHLATKCFNLQICWEPTLSPNAHLG